MGSVTKRVVETFTSAILITISGELTGPIENLIVEEVEVIEKPDLIDFGELEMEYQPDYD
ncbi:hypothetical protein [Candidatus Symbiopectobacterium sp. NZEC135]|nr:hypothetical protein [Candidatus Symbiopectobacterium sp. NZEC135]